MKYGHYQMIISIDENDYMDHTWNDINNALIGGFNVQALVKGETGVGFFPVTAAYISGDDYMIACQANEDGFSTDSPIGYPLAVGSE